MLNSAQIMLIFFKRSRLQSMSEDLVDLLFVSKDPIYKSTFYHKYRLSFLAPQY